MLKKSFVLTGRKERDEQSAMFVFKKSSAQGNGSVYSLNTRQRQSKYVFFKNRSKIQDSVSTREKKNDN